jgi:type VI secretion system protein ImpH
MASPSGHEIVTVTEPTAIQRLTADPASFTFDAALRLLMHRAETTDPSEAARFQSAPGLAFAPSDVVAVDVLPDPPAVKLGLLGLIGAAGVLPRRYTEQAASADGDALHAMADLLAHRMLAALGTAGFKYRLERAVETARLVGDDRRSGHAEILLAVAGFAEPGVVERLPFAGDALLHYAGSFVLRPRSAERLAALASDWLGRTVKVIEFVGAWLPIEQDQRTRLGIGREQGAFSALGRDAAVGVRAWDPQARVMLRIGPLDRAAFEALLPDKAALKAFIGLVRAYLGFEVGFGVNLVLAAADVPAVRLDGRGMLGWNSWLGRGKGYVARGDADDARFAAETVEG